MAKYRHGIVTFLDLLGFAAAVNGGTSPDDILKMMKAVRKASHEDADTKKVVKIEYLCISDCMIRSLHLENPSKVTAPELQQELLDLVHMQCQLIWNGYPVRGAVTHGDIYFKGKTLFGPAYQKAYLLEKEANTPRIIVDPQVIADFIGYPEGRGDLTFGNAQEELHGQIRRDVDGQWFVDYLRSVQTETEYDEDYLKFLLAHRKLISERIKTHGHDSKVLSKYQWMRGYHNLVVGELADAWFDFCGVTRANVLV